jgi:hypothetical protein
MCILKVRKEVVLLKEQLAVAIGRPHKHVTLMIKNGGTSVLKIPKDDTLLREERDMSILRERKAVRLLV